MKKIIKITLILFLFLLYLYKVAIDNIPSSLILFEGETLNINTIYGISIKNSNKNYDAITTSSSINGQNFSKTGSTTLAVNLFGEFTVKTIEVDVIEKVKVVPLGDIAGVKLYTTGALVVGMAEVEGANGQKYNPCKNIGIKEGDTIVEVNGESIENTESLIKNINKSEGQDISVKYIRDGSTLECKITPVKTKNNEYKIGLWVRDSAAGIGTVTFYEPESGTFGALGHGITDIDTGDLIEISSGEFVTTKILSILKGEKNNPGKVQGTIENQNTIGIINKNTEFGIYGNVTDLSEIDIDEDNLKEVASRNEIKKGKATILCNLDGEKAEEYEIEIEKIFINNNENNKSMLIRITDKKLLEKTGGIIQGMSGSPVIQNGKFVGAVTHVLVP